MKPRRWFSGPVLNQWRYMTACGQVDGPFFLFPEFWSVLGYEAQLRHERFVDTWIGPWRDAA